MIAARRRTLEGDLPAVAGIPALGFGTYGMGRADIIRTVPAALEAGFRHIDTAQIYRNEADIGECIAASRVSRSDLFLTTKVWVANYPEPAFLRSVDESLKNLQTDYIDLLLLHWPSNAVSLEEQIAGLNSAVRAGKVRHVGISNFNRAMMADAVRLSEAPIVTNQFEYHPYLNQTPLIDACRQIDVAVTAYCGMAVGRVFDDLLLGEIATERGKTIAQVVLRWLVQQEGVIALSRSTSPDRIADNARIFDFALSPQEMNEIGKLARERSRIVNPPGLAPAWDPTPCA